VTEPIRWSEASIISALAVAFEWWRRDLCPNVQEGSEMDMALLTKAGLLWEIEIKISMADWKADLKKERRYNPGWSPARFYYAVPAALVANGIPEWAPAHAGVLRLRNELQHHTEPNGRRVIGHGPRSAGWLRQAKILHKVKAPPFVREALRAKIYARYWRHVAPQITATAPATIEVPHLAETP